MESEKRLIDANELTERLNHAVTVAYPNLFPGLLAAVEVIADSVTVDAVEVPETGIGDLSDGYHTFNSLYYQRLMLFAALVKAHKERAWKSYRHEDGELCFGGGWFVVGIDTPEGIYTYHYENQYFDLFDCEELPVGKRWDGHTEKNVIRLLSITNDTADVLRCKDCKHYEKETLSCGNILYNSGYLQPRWYEDSFCSYGEKLESPFVVENNAGGDQA